jgi:hypothetical protein
MEDIHTPINQLAEKMAKEAKLYCLRVTGEIFELSATNKSEILVEGRLPELSDDNFFMIRFPFPKRANNWLSSYTITHSLELAHHLRDKIYTNLKLVYTDNNVPMKIKFVDIINAIAKCSADDTKLYRVYISGEIVECNATDDYETPIEGGLSKFGFKTRRYRFPLNDIKRMTSYTITPSLESAYTLRSLIDSD